MWSCVIGDIITIGRYSINVDNPPKMIMQVVGNRMVVCMMGMGRWMAFGLDYYYYIWLIARHFKYYHSLFLRVRAQSSYML